MESLATFALAVPALGAAGMSFAWLLVQAVTRRRAGWVSAVALPAVLAIGSGVAMLPQIQAVFTDGGPRLLAVRLLAVLVAAAAGALFDLGSSLAGGEGKRSGAPLLLWGSGAACYVLAPLGSYLRPLDALLETGAGAVGLTSGFALLGQASSWALRFVGIGQTEPNPARRRAGAAGGTAATLLALLLLLAGGGSRGGVAPSARGGPVAPPGSFVLSTAGALSNGPLHLYDPGGDSYRKLPIEGSRVRWSRDGRRLAFTRVEPSELWVAGADGSSARKLAAIPGVLSYISWSADGERIYLAHSTGFLAGDLLEVPASGGAPRQLLPVSEGVDFPEVSPDGRTLAYIRGADTTSTMQPPRELKLLDLASGQTRSLVTDPTASWNVTGLAWTADGGALLLGCASDANGRQYRLERVDLSSPERRALTPPMSFYPASFATVADGSAVALLAFPRVNGNPDPSRPAELWLVNPGDGSRRSIPMGGAVKPESMAASPTR